MKVLIIFRLELSPAKLESLSAGLMQIADTSYNNVGKVWLLVAKLFYKY